jgi:hypothetical protein
MRREEIAVKLNRQLFLRGLGDTVVALPLLGSLVESGARAQGVDLVGAPRRLIVMFTHDGCITRRGFPSQSRGPLTEAEDLGTSLEVLAPLAGKLLVTRGMRAMNEWTVTGDLGQGNDIHTQAVRIHSTCVPVDSHTSDPFALNNVETTLNADGGKVDVGKFKSAGTPREIADAPINKHFCNPMNAIGVKAGPDGFASEGGTEEVTHCGVYDRKEDCAG